MPTVQVRQIFYGTLPLVATILLAMWNNNKRLDDLNTTLNKPIDDLTNNVNTGFADVKAGIGKLDVRVTELEKSTRLIRN